MESVYHIGVCRLGIAISRLHTQVALNSNLKLSSFIPAHSDSNKGTRGILFSWTLIMYKLLRTVLCALECIVCIVVTSYNGKREKVTTEREGQGNLPACSAFRTEREELVALIVAMHVRQSSMPVINVVSCSLFQRSSPICKPMAKNVWAQPCKCG